MVNVEERKKQRFQFLRRLYERTDGNQHNSVIMWDLGKDLGFDKNETNLIVQYLEGEGLLEYDAMGGSIVITHYGVLETEQALSNPEQPTEHFPALNIIQIGQMVGSTIQQSSPDATQIVTIDVSNFDEVKRLLDEIAMRIDSLGLDEGAKRDVEAEVATIRAQLSTSRPKATVITECLASIKTILESAAGGALGAGLISQLAALLSG